MVSGKWTKKTKQSVSLLQCHCFLDGSQNHSLPSNMSHIPIDLFWRWWSRTTCPDFTPGDLEKARVWSVHTSFGYTAKQNVCVAATKKLALTCKFDSNPNHTRHHSELTHWLISSDAAAPPAPLPTHTGNWEGLFASLPLAHVQCSRYDTGNLDVMTPSAAGGSASVHDGR